jgi:hypothetical protein
MEKNELHLLEENAVYLLQALNIDLGVDFLFLQCKYI